MGTRESVAADTSLAHAASGSSGAPINLGGLEVEPNVSSASEEADMSKSTVSAPGQAILNSPEDEGTCAYG